jgi:hypothetical protein
MAPAPARQTSSRSWSIIGRSGAPAGVLVSNVYGGFANGFQVTQTINPTAGLRVKFWDRRTEAAGRRRATDEKSAAESFVRAALQFTPNGYYGGPQTVTYSGSYSPFWKLTSRQLEAGATLAAACPGIMVTISGATPGEGSFTGTSL